jgi:hypothetical protein
MCKWKGKEVLYEKDNNNNNNGKNKIRREKDIWI